MNFFVITPHKFDELFETKQHMIKRVSEKFGMVAHYAPTRNSGERFDLDETIYLFSQVDFFIADLSFERPSCYFEVGFVQALKKKVYIIALEGTDIHQVLNREECLFYKNLQEYENIIVQCLSINSRPIVT